MRRQQRARLGSARNIVWIGVTIISLSLFVAALRVSGSVRDLQARMAAVEQLTQGNGGFDLARVRDDLSAVKSDLAEIRGDVGWLFPLTPLFGWLPQIGGDVAALGDVFNLADDLVSAADVTFDGWSQVTNAVTARANGSAPPITEGIIVPLADNRQTFALAQGYLARARAYRARIHVDNLSARTAPLVQRVDRFAPLLELAVDASRALPDLLGANGTRQYLIVAQNEDELRATGGFASAAGLLTVERGQIVGLEFMDTYQVDDLEQDFPQPPEPIEKYMLAGYWLFRDANWSPDFPTAARQLASLYELGKRKHVDGVIAVDQEMVRLLVGSLGSVVVPGDPPTTVTSDNVLRFMRESWAPPPNAPVGPAWLARKNFVGNLAKAMQTRVLDSGQINAAALGRGVYDALRGRHLLLYFPNTALADGLARTGWDGALQASDGDYLMVVDSNLGFNKANALISQQFTYAVALASDSTARATLTIAYRQGGVADGKRCVRQVPDFGPNTTYEMLMDQCYWDYVRVLAPQGSVLRDASRHPIPSAQLQIPSDANGEAETRVEDGKQLFANLFFVARGGEQTVRFGYELPRGVVRDVGHGMSSYALLWQKQPGAPPIPTQFTFTLPRNATLVRVSTPTAARATSLVADGAVRVNVAFDLAGDTMLEVVFRRN